MGKAPRRSSSEQRPQRTRLRGRAWAVTASVLLVPGLALAQGLPTADELDAPEPPAPEERDEAFLETADEVNDAVEERVRGGEVGAEGDGEAAVSEAVVVGDGVVVGADREPRAETTLNLEGTVGLQHVARAYGGAPMTFRVAFLGELYSGSNTVRAGDSNTLAAGHLLLQGSFSEHFGAWLGIGARNNTNTFGQPQAALSQGDLVVGFGGYYPDLGEGLSVGADLTFYVPSLFNSAGLDFSATSVRPRLLASLELGELADEPDLALAAHLNLGYRFDSTQAGVPEEADLQRVDRLAYGISAYDYVELGLGVDYDLPYVTPFLGYRMDVPVAGAAGVCDNDAALPCAAETGFAGWPKRLSLGAKVSPVEHLVLHGGLDLGLAVADTEGVPVTLPYNIVLGVSWEIDPRTRIQIVEREKIVEKEKIVDRTLPQGVLVGTIVDAETGRPVPEALILYEGTDRTPQATATATGAFTSYAFTPDSTIKIVVRHPDYEATEAAFKVAEGRTELTPIKLTPIAKVAFVSGQVLDQKDKAVDAAQVTLTGPRTYTLRTDASGTFRQQVVPGDYTLAAKAEGYMTRGKDLKIAADQRENVMVVLQPEPKQKLVELREDKIEIRQKIFFETGKSRILPKSFPLLDQVVAAILENPRLRIEIEGHTDDVGTMEYNMELSQARSESVRNYLIGQGVSPDRLTSKGFGPTRPILPNTSKRNRDLNRRVEFKIVRKAAPAAATPAAPAAP